VLRIEDLRHGLGKRALWNRWSFAAVRLSFDQQIGCGGRVELGNGGRQSSSKLTRRARASQSRRGRWLMCEAHQGGGRGGGRGMGGMRKSARRDPPDRLGS
jgi:hypothetical protein